MGVTIVTGAAGRIGSAVAAALARRDRRLVVTDLDGDALDAVAGGLGDAVSFTADLRVDAEVEALVAGAAAEPEGIEAVVNAAGVEGPIALAEDAGPDAVRHVFDVNVLAIFRVLAAVLPHLKAAGGGGRIVNVSSGAGLGGVAYLSAYSASKHAVVGLTRSVALEVAGHGIAVNAVCPGCVESEMMDRIEAGLGRLTGEAASFAASIPAGRYAEAAEIASLVAYLVCDAPAYLTGASLVIDGGLRV